MFLSIGQIREIVDSFMELTQGEPTHLTLALEYRHADGSEKTMSGGYGLEGLYPERETSADVIPQEVKRLCAWCDKPLTVEQDTLCDNCGADYHEDYYDRGDDDA